MSEPEKLVLFDLDDTLIDSEYQVTDDRVREAVAQAQAAGWSIGLNSDTPYAALRQWQTRFGMNGPIVAEKGSVVGAAGWLSLDQAAAAKVSASQQAVKQFADEKGFATWSGNPVEAIRANMCYGRPGQTVLLLNALSHCSLRFFVRVTQPDGSLQIDNERTQTVIDACRRYFPKFQATSEDNNPRFGLVIVASAEANKRSGVQQLLARLGLERCVMVGNSMSDYIGEDIAEHFAVANASSEYRAVAKTVTEPVTAGAVQVLHMLAAKRNPVNVKSMYNGE